MRNGASVSQLLRLIVCRVRAYIDIANFVICSHSSFLKQYRCRFHAAVGMSTTA